jgi:hypothetical protein
MVAEIGASHLADLLRIEVEQIRSWAMEDDVIPERIVLLLTEYRIELKFVEQQRSRSAETGDVYALFEDG